MKIFRDGGEAGDVSFWDSDSYMENITTNPHSGLYHYHTLGTNAAPKSFADISEGYFSVAYNKTTYNGSDMIRFRNGATTIFTISETAAYKRSLYVGGSLVATSSGGFSTNTYYTLELYFKIADSNGKLILKQDGITFLDFTGDTKPGTDTTINNFYFDTYSRAYIDDLGLNDTDNSDGRNDNSWIGQINIEYHPANAEGDVQQWLVSSGTSHYQMVDEIPPDGDTTYVYASGVGQREMFNVTDYTSTNKVITRIWTEGRAKDNQGVGSQIKLGMKTGGNVYLQGSGITLASTYAQRLLGPDYKVNPVGSGIWSGSDINAIQTVIESE